MASEEEDLAEQDCFSPTASTSQVAQATPLDDSEDPSRLVSQDAINNEACGSSCRHCFCFLCTEEWASRTEVCPTCQRPLQHLFPKMSGQNHELDDIMCNDNDSRGRSRSRSEGWWQRSPGLQCHGSSSRGRGGGHARAQRWSSSWSQDGRRWGYSSLRSRRQQRAGWDSSRRWHVRRRQSLRWPHSTGGQALWEHLRGHRSRRQWWNRDRERPRAWESQRSRFPEQGNPGTLAYSSPARWRWGSWNPDEHRAPRPERAVLAFLRRSRFWPRSRSTWSRAQRERQRRRDWDEVPTYPGRRARHQGGRRSSFRAQRAARSQCWWRSCGRARRRTW